MALVVCAFVLATAPAAPAATALQCAGSAPTSALQPDTFTALWQRRGPGWTGGDGARSVRLPGGRVLWAFGDTFLGTVNAAGVRADDTPLVDNTIVVQDSACLRTYYGGTSQAPRALLATAGQPGQGRRGRVRVVPRGRCYTFCLPFEDGAPSRYSIPPGGTALWPGEPIFTGGRRIQMVMGQFEGVLGGWFMHTAAYVATLSWPTLDVVSLKRLAAPRGVLWGDGLLVDGAWTYICGTDLGSGKELYLARARTDRLEHDSSWHYFSGSGWSSDPAARSPIDRGAEGCHLVREAGGYLLIHQHQGIFAGTAEIYAHTSRAPSGPWSSAEELAVIPPLSEGLFSYGATPHPAFSARGRLLIGYSVSSIHRDAFFRDASVYRPRFMAASLSRLEPVITIAERSIGATSSGIARVPLTCTRGIGDACQGRLELAERRIRERRRFSIKAGTTGVVALRLPRDARNRRTLRVLVRSRSITGEAVETNAALRVAR